MTHHSARYWPDDTAAAQLDRHLRRYHRAGWTTTHRTPHTATITRNGWPAPIWLDILLGVATCTLWLLPMAILRAWGNRHPVTRTVRIHPDGRLETLSIGRR